MVPLPRMAPSPAAQEDGWSIEAIQALQTAVYSVDATHANYWQEVARHVPGKTAGAPARLLRQAGRRCPGRRASQPHRALHAASSCGGRWQAQQLPGRCPYRPWGCKRSACKDEATRRAAAGLGLRRGLGAVYACVRAYMRTAAPAGRPAVPRGSQPHCWPHVRAGQQLLGRCCPGLPDWVLISIYIYA